ncbi:putative Root UVB sensitive family [Septoria linicola]|nr:putative Root UVB sensitive family [Septoria linicola]
MASKSLRIQEYNDADNVVATYVQSEGTEKERSRIDVLRPDSSKSVLSLWHKTLDVFLPVGFPQSVTDDYLEYQIYDSLQAFSSSIAAMLSSRAVLEGVGVGDATANATTALLLSILQDSVGRITTILFAHRFGMSLEPECKMYRLLADILNDTGFVLDCLSPIFPKPTRVVILSFSSILRSLCGVAAGSAKASLSAHFAKQGNLGELNAKDSSQETVISLAGMLFGSWVITWVKTPFATWTALILLLSIHLETNRRAVRAVKMHTLNRQRATLVYHHLRKGHVPTPAEVASQERIFERDGVLRSKDEAIIGHCSIGAPLSRLLAAIGDEQQTTKAVRVDETKLNQILSVYESSEHLLWLDKTSTKKRAEIFVVLKKQADFKTLTIAWWQALAFAESLRAVPLDVSITAPERISQLAEIVRKALGEVNKLWDLYHDQLEQLGWDMSSPALETVAETRVAISS